MQAEPTVALGPVIEVGRRDTDQSEREARLSDATVKEMRRAGLFRMCVPAALGGTELDPIRVMDIIYRLSEVDGALGWSAMIAATSGCVAGHLSLDCAREMFGPDDLVVGPFAPLGTADQEAGNYRVSGRWPFVSMCEAATWIMSGTVLPDGGRRLLFAPAVQYRIHHTWSVLGLCATGSHDVELDKVSVPAERSVSLRFDEPRQPGPLYAFPVLGLISAGIATVSLGIAAAAVDHLVELAGNKTPTYSVRRLGERPSVQTAVAAGQSRLRSAHGLLADAVAAAWQQARTVGSVDLDHRVAIRLAAVEATDAAVTVVAEMYRCGGGSSIYRRDPAQRRLRDVYTAAQHAMVSPALREVAGRHRLGLRIDESTV